MANKSYKNKKITLPMQYLLLKSKFPESQVSLKMNRLVWYGKIKPTPLSRVYNIKVVCEKNLRPRVFLHSDYIKGIEKSDFPHIYYKSVKGNIVELCLNMPQEFNYTHKLVDTIIPWAQEWLFHYEIWLSTGEWRGGGHTLS